jgi:tetratricopeptide (TPR) repeat protein
MLPRRLSSRLVLALAALAAASLAQEPAAPDPRVLFERLRSSALASSPPLRLEHVRLDTGSAVLDLVDGYLFPAEPVGERAVEMVFVGDGIVHLEAPDAVEAGQLELFTGSDVLRERFTEAVFVVARDAAARALLERPAAAADAAVARRARARFASWRASPERRLLGVDAGILGDALGDPYAEEYFAAWFRGDDLGDFLLLVDPAAEEPLSLGQFVPLDVGEREKRRFSRVLSREQRRGRLIGLEVDDLGTWDTWVSAARGVDGRKLGGVAAFEPRHYRLDVTVDPRHGELTGRAEVELVAASGGRRLARLSLHRDLAVTRVAVAEVEVPHLREGSEIHLVLPAAPAAGAAVTVAVDYAGQYLDRRDRNWTLRDALAWYPHAGEVDRATYDVTLRRPPRLDLLAGGRWVASGGDKKLRWERRALDVPALGFSFEVGRYVVRRVHAGQVAVTVAFDPDLVAVAGDSLADVLAAITDSLAFYEQLFGPYPLPELTVVTVPREQSQAMLGFVTLSNAMMVDWGALGAVLGVTDRRAVVAHEIAHQWWGHQVGWRGYRDQWISEAMANYASQLWTRRRLASVGPGGPTEGWQEELTRPVADGRPLESVGPLVLGRRLDSSRADGAYEAIVYRKGALVLGMLARRFGEERFVEMLRAIAVRNRGRVLSTGEFLGQLEELSATDLELFARQFVYGVGLPEIFYTYEFTPLDDGRWRVRIAARQEPPQRFRYEVVERAGGALDVARRRFEAAELGGAPLAVPFQVVFTGGALGVQGQISLTGERSELTFEVEHRPDDVWLDTRREVYGRFFNERRHPKRTLLYQGFDLAASGENAEAEAYFRQALMMPPPVLRGVSPALEQLQAVADRLLNAQIHLELARVRMSGDRDEEARASLEEARQALERSEQPWIAGDLDLLEARLEIRRGDYARAFRRLRKDVLRRRRLDAAESPSAESYLLLAIAARETGNERELAEAVAAARRKGAVVSLLSR